MEHPHMATKSIQAFPRSRRPRCSEGTGGPAVRWTAVPGALRRSPVGRSGAGPAAATANSMARPPRPSPVSAASCLPVTGEFDEAMRTQMSKHRCGMPHFVNGVAFVTRCAWPTPQLTFAFEDGTLRRPASSMRCAPPSRPGPGGAGQFTEVAATQSPDVAIDRRRAADPTTR